MAIDLYATLGLKRSASQDEIRTAYRFVARRVHPDAGGTSDEFQRVKLAFDILGDPERRKRYDATGDASEKEPDRSAAELFTITNAALDHAFQQIVASGRDPTKCDLIGEVTLLIAAKTEELRGKLAEIEAVTATLKDLRSRVRAKKGGGTTRLHSVFDGKIGQAERQAEKLVHGISQHERVLELLGEASFRFDQPEPASVKLMFSFNSGSFV